jgi:uncharacterized protein (TIGR02271 family)
MDYATNATDVGTTTHVVVGLFDNANDAHQAVNQLRGNGFSSSQIGAAFRGRSLDRYTDRGDATTPSGTVHHENWWEKVKDAFRSDDKVETRREVATDSTFATDPYAEGEYEYDFADEDFHGSLEGAGIPSDRAAYLTRNLQAGGAIVTVRDANRTAEAEQILSANHGKVQYEDLAGTNVAGTNLRAAGVAEAGVAGTDFARSDYRGDVVTPGVAGTEYTDRDRADTDETAIDAADSTGREITDTGYVGRRPANAGEYAGDRVQLFGEVLRVHKERISRGEVRVRKDVVTENQTIEVPVTREELVLERVAVSPNTPASSANIGRSQEIRVPLSEDSVRVEKQPVVREEVMVGKREVSDVARVGDQVRHEELRVDSDLDTPDLDTPGLDTPTRTAAGEDFPGDRSRRG